MYQQQKSVAESGYIKLCVVCLYISILLLRFTCLYRLVKMSQRFKISQIGKFFTGKSKIMNSEKTRLNSFENCGFNSRSTGIQILAILGFYCVNDKPSKIIRNSCGADSENGRSGTTNKIIKTTNIQRNNYSTLNLDLINNSIRNINEENGSNDNYAGCGSNNTIMATNSWTSDTNHEKCCGCSSPSVYGNKDILKVQCYYCGAQRTMTSGDNMRLTHKLNCSLINGGGGTQSTVVNYEQHIGRLRVLLELNCFNTIFVYYRCNEEMPAFPNFASVNARFESFRTWPGQIKQKPSELAKNGFFYSLEGDCVICFQCACHCANWDVDDDIIEKHQSAGSCYFFDKIIYIDGEKNITKRCLICEDEAVDTVFLPCTHCMTCRACSMQLFRCPLCRGEIENVIGFYY